MKKAVYFLGVIGVSSLFIPGIILAMGGQPPPVPKALKKPAAAPTEKAKPVAPARKEALPKREGPQPKIVFTEKEYDFGEVKGVDRIEHIYKFHNEGKADLKIDKVKTSCGCTAALLSAKVIPPGKEGEIKTTFTFGRRQGKQTKHIYVSSNDPDEPNEKLTLKGVIVPVVSVEPNNIYFRDPQKERKKKVTISQTLDEELKLGEITTHRNLVDTKLEEATGEGGKKLYTLEVSIKPDMEPGHYSDSVTIATNYKDKPKINIPIRFNIRGDIEAIPSRVNLGALTPGQEVTRKLRIINRKKTPFAIEKFDIDNPVVSVDLKTPTASETTHELTVKARAEADTRTIRAKLVLYTDYEKQQKVMVDIYGFIRK